MTAIVELKNVTKAVSNGMNEEKVILDDVSLEIREHDFITILGGNGAGKSTLFNTNCWDASGEQWKDLYFGRRCNQLFS